jgi:heme/copper-type cytochrome/quinol oxidase subunit 3
MTMRITLLGTVLVGTLTMLPGAAIAAQPRTPAARPPDAAPAAVDERSAEETRQRLRDVLGLYPPSVPQVLRLDPSLLTRPDYLTTYPSLAAFVTQHPEVAHNPVFFFGEARLNGADIGRRQGIEAAQEVLAGIAFFLAFMTMMSIGVWLARAAIDYRRWLRATKIQTDVHMKLVDRLTSNEDLMAYMQSPAGQRFLASSPVAIDAAPNTVGAPLNRILWSVQAGVVLAASGVGLWFAKTRVIDEAAQVLHVISLLAMALGVGFVLSALLSYALSRQLGLVEPQAPHA